MSLPSRIRTVIPFATLALLLVSLFTAPAQLCAKQSNRPSGWGTLGVWEQSVNYVLDVTLERDLRTINGRIEIEYTNNSPDTLRVLYLKAFPNATQKDSYADKKRRTVRDYSLANRKPEQMGSLELMKIEGDPRSIGTFQFDNSIITLYLEKPINPGTTRELVFDFRTVLPSPDELRMGYQRDVTKAVYWYPQVCVYDSKLGWTNSQYVGWGESYGDFGTFDVRITAPENQVVAATGELMNRGEVLPDSLRQALDIKNYLSPRQEWPELEFDSSQTKTWHYHAEQVNDFVFTASSIFCIDSGSVRGVKVVAYPLRQKAKGWVDAVRLGKEAIETFSELIYPYQWPVIRICDAFSGMEYPMLTNCSGQGPAPYFSMLLYHEIGHQWFMGQVGSNQVDRPFLDEGFTTHIEHIAMEKYLGRENNYTNYSKWYEKKFYPPVEDRNARGFRPLMLLLKQGFDKPMSFSYDQGEEYWPYRVSAYYKSAAMHYSLRSILGDSLYFRAMHHYCSKWFFHHPYEDDFTQAMEEATGLELDNYLNQWYYNRYRLDYAYAGRSRKRLGRYYEHTIKLKKYGKFVAPIDVAVIWEQGDTTLYTIAPEGMGKAKPGFVLLPTWEQFRRLNDKYEFKVKAERNIKSVIVDPFNLLIDINRMNNRSGLLPAMEVRLDNMKFDRTPVYRYALRWRPDLWYDEPNGTQVGFHAHGSYLEVDNKFSLDLDIGTESGRASVDLMLSHPFKPFGYGSNGSWRVLRTDRRTFLSNALDKRFKSYYSLPDNQYFRAEVNYINVSGRQADRFDPLPEGVSEYFPEPTWNASASYYMDLSASSLTTFRYGSYYFQSSNLIGMYEDGGRQGGFEITNNELGLTLTHSSKNWLELRLVQLGVSGEPPVHFLPHISRQSQVETFIHSRVFRTTGTFPEKWRDDFYLSSGFVRGYQDRTIYILEAFGGSLELTPPDLLPYQWFRHIPLVGGFFGRVDQSLFVDASSISMDGKEVFYPLLNMENETQQFYGESEIYLSAGVSLTMPPVWTEHRVRVDFPIYLNKPSDGEDEFEFRFSVAWLLPTSF